METPWPAVVLGALALLTAGLTISIIRRRRPQRRAWRVAIVGGLCALLLAATGTAFGVNAAIGYAPTVASMGQIAGLSALGTPFAAAEFATAGQQSSSLLPSVLWPTGPGRVVFFTLGSPALEIPSSKHYVYLPPGYGQSQRRYPVVYLLHGHPGGSEDWMRSGRAARTMDLLVNQRVLPPMIIVSPDVTAGLSRDSSCLDAVDGPQITTFLLQDIIGWVDTHLLSKVARTQRALGGMSSGGYCTLDVGVQHADRFSVLLAMVPYGDPGESVLQPILGGSKDLFDAHSPSLYLPKVVPAAPLAIFLDSGDADPAEVLRVRALYDLIRQRGWDAEFRIEPGQGHNWYEARAGLPWALLFAARHFAESS